MIDRLVSASVTWHPRQSNLPQGVSVQARHFAIAKLAYSHRKHGSSPARYTARHAPSILSQNSTDRTASVVVSDRAEKQRIFENEIFGEKKESKTHFSVFTREFPDSRLYISYQLDALIIIYS